MNTPQPPARLTAEIVSGNGPDPHGGSAVGDSDVCLAAVDWLDTFANIKTRNAHASRLGLPAAWRRWTGAPSKVTLDWNAWLPWCAVHGIHPLTATRQDIRSWLHRQTELRTDEVITENTRRARYDTVATWYSWLAYEGRIDHPPTLNRDEKGRQGLVGRRPSPTKPLTVPQVRALQLAARYDTRETNGSPLSGAQRRLRSMVIVELLAATGMRADELCGLRLGDYRPSAGPEAPATLWLENAKGGHPREVEVFAESTAVLDAYLAHGRVDPPGSDVPARPGDVHAGHRAKRPLITGDRGQRLHPDTIGPLLQRLATIPRPDSDSEAMRHAAHVLRPLWSANHGRGGKGRFQIHPHQMRHSWAVHARDHSGAEASVIAAQLGHASIATSQNYLDGSAARTRTAAREVTALYHGGDQLRLSTSSEPLTDADTGEY